MKDYLLVGIGGMLGSIARYGSGSYFLHNFPNARFPWATFFVNLLGCLIIGMLAGCTERLSNFNSELRLAGMIGFLGGFTTFSAYGIETLHLLKSGETSLALIYALASLVFGVFFAYLGLKFCS